MTTRHIAFIFVVLLLSVSLAACAGFDIGDIVRVRTPNTLQKTHGLRSTTTLNEAEAEYQAWFEETQRSGMQWRANIERGGEVRSLLSQLSLSTLDEFGPMIAGVPVLGPALPTLAGLLGLFIGTGRLRKEKEASFNKGMKEGKNGVTPAAATVTT